MLVNRPQLIAGIHVGQLFLRHPVYPLGVGFSSLVRRSPSLNKFYNRLVFIKSIWFQGVLLHNGMLIL